MKDAKERALQPLTTKSQQNKSEQKAERDVQLLTTCYATIVPQLDKCLKFLAFQGIILYRVQSFLSPRIDLNFRHYPVVTL